METLGDDVDDDTLDNARPFLMGKVAAVVNDKLSAKQIIDEMVDGAVSSIQTTNAMIVSSTRL